MGIPRYVEFRLPLLRALGDGGEHRLVDLHGKISDDLGLSEEERTQFMPNRNKTYVYGRVNWTATRLKEAGLLSRTRPGSVKITPRGEDVLKDPPAIIDNKYLRGLGYIPNTRRADSTEKRDDDDAPPDDVLKHGFEQARSALYGELKEAVMQVSHRGFEQLVLELLRKMGYGDWERTGGSGDGGIDGIVRKDRLGLGEIRVQAKHWTPNVSPRYVREFMGALRGKEGIFITASTFTPNAEKEIDGSNIVLIDGEKLVELMWEYGVGVSDVETLKIKALDSEYFDQFK